MEALDKAYFSYSLLKPGIHLITIKNVEPTKDIFDEYLNFFELAAKEKKGSFVFDLSNGKFLSSEQRIKIGNVVKTHSGRIASNWHSIAYVNTSAVAAIILKGIFLVSPLPVKSKVFTSLVEAEAWVLKA